MEDIPVKFEWRGQWYSGIFTAPYGNGGNSWHLMINDRYLGSLINRPTGWYFGAARDNMFEDMADWFGDYVQAWIG